MNQSIESEFEWAPGVKVEWWAEAEEGDDPKRPVVGFSLNYGDHLDVGNRCVLNVDSGEIEEWPFVDGSSYEELRGLLTNEVSEAWGKR
jgi:hypothetical protein